MEPILTFINDNLTLSIVFVLSMIEISPIKINPWGYIAKLFKKAVVGEISEKIDCMEKKIGSIEKVVADSKVDQMRWDILDFSNSCRNGRKHSREEWMHLIDQITKYDQICTEMNIENGVIEIESKYLKELYKDRLKQNDFL